MTYLQGECSYVRAEEVEKTQRRSSACSQWEEEVEEKEVEEVVEEEEEAEEEEQEEEIERRGSAGYLSINPLPRQMRRRQRGPRVPP